MGIAAEIIARGTEDFSGEVDRIAVLREAAHVANAEAFDAAVAFGVESPRFKVADEARMRALLAWGEASADAMPDARVFRLVRELRARLENSY